MTGTIDTLRLDRGFGFIRRDDGAGDVFFHAKDLAADLPFDEQLMERRVTFDVATTAKGQRAANIRPR